MWFLYSIWFHGYMAIRAASCLLALAVAVADPGKGKGGWQSIEREARVVKPAQNTKMLGLRPLPVQ